MTDSRFDPAELVQIEERLRQQRETFNQRKAQQERWFSLRLRMGYTAMVFLPTIGALCGYIIVHGNTASVVISAGATLFTDILGVFAAVWKVVLNPVSITPVEPITEMPAIELAASRERARFPIPVPAMVKPSPQGPPKR